jgi:hypothetical protein
MPDLLRDAITGLWLRFFGASDLTFSSPSSDRFALAAWIEIRSADTVHRVVLRAPEGLGETMALCVLPTHAREMASALGRDVLCEVVNMLAGSLKGRLSGRRSLSLPQLEDDDGSLHHDALAGWQCEWAAQRFELWVLRVDRGQRT